MDLAQFDSIAGAEEGAVMEVRNPATDVLLVTEDGTPLTITLAGADSERCRRVQRQATNRRIANQAMRRSKVTVEEMESEGLDLLAACTLAWTGMVVDGVALPCTPANARTVYKRLPWLREQVDQFIAERANFLKASPSI